MKTSFFSSLFDDLTPSRLVPIISMALVMGVMLLIFAVSFAAMIFSGELAPFASRGTGLFLTGTFVLCTISALTSSFKGVIPLPQDAPTAVLSAMAVSVAVGFGPQGSPEEVFMTVAAAVGASGLFTGLCFWIVGRYRLANLLRFMPYPVVGGFLAGTGWLLVSGSIGVMCDASLSLQSLPRLMTAELMTRWVPGVLFAFVVFAVLLKRPQAMMLPASLAAGAVVFYLALPLTGTSIEEAKASGFLVSGVPAQGLWPAVGLSDLSLIHWPAAARQLPAVLSATLVSVVGMLLNTSGIEVGTRSEIDINDEFKVFGAGNAVAGLFGSAPGYPSISLSLLAHKAGADSRLTGSITALLIGAVLFFGGAVLGYFPKCLLGGLVLLLGIMLIHDWIVATRSRLPLVDWGIVLFIFLVTAFFGFMEGVASGLVATVLFFVFRFSRVPVVKQVFTAAERSSIKARSVPHRHILTAEGRRICGYELTGYLFFGSASSLLDRLKAALTARPSPDFLVLDFTLVTGFDISAVNTFQRAAFTAQSSGCRLVITSVPRRLEDAVRRNFPPDLLQTTAFFDTIDKGLEWCEDHLIREMEARLSSRSDLRQSMFDSSVDDTMKQLENQEAVERLVLDLENWLEIRTFEAGSAIVAQGAELSGLFLITQGNAVEYDPKTGHRRRFLEPGCVVGAPAAVSAGHTAASTIRADTDCEAAFFSFQARQKLEKEDPDSALRLYRYLIELE